MRGRGKGRGGRQKFRNYSDNMFYRDVDYQASHRQFVWEILNRIRVIDYLLSTYNLSVKSTRTGTEPEVAPFRMGGWETGGRTGAGADSALQLPQRIPQLSAGTNFQGSSSPSYSFSSRLPNSLASASLCLVNPYQRSFPPAPDIFVTPS